MDDDIFIIEEKTPVSKADCYDAIKEADGNLSAAARELGISRNRLKTIVDGNITLAALVADLNEEIVDVAEENHRARVRKGDDPTAERFILQTLGKGRGYSMGVAGTGKDGEIIVKIQKLGEAP